MVPKRGWHNTLITVYAVLIMMAIATLDQHRRSVGPEVCKHHCGQFRGCTICMFLIRRLVCTASMAKYPPRTNEEETVYLNFTKERLGSIAQRTECEDRHSRMVLTRSNGLRCVALEREENTRLLVVPAKERSKTPLRSFHLLNGSMTTYHHVKPHFVSAMAYAPTLGQVLIGTSKQRKIQAFSLHTNFSVTLRRKMHVLSIAVDSGQQLVFLATMYPYMCVNRMTSDGRYLKNITRPMRAYAICLDVRREIVYITSRYYVCSLTYDGDGHHLLTLPPRAKGPTLGENGNAMYYIYDSDIMDLELSENGTGRKLTSLDFKVAQILYNKGYLYITSIENNVIHVWYESKISRFKGDGPAGVSGQWMALMPDNTLE